MVSSVQFTSSIHVLFTHTLLTVQANQAADKHNKISNEVDIANIKFVHSVSFVSAQVRVSPLLWAQAIFFAETSC